MPDASGAKSFFFHLERRLFFNNWTAPQRATIIALFIEACAVNNGIGVLRLRPGELADVMSTYQIDAVCASESQVLQWLSELQTHKVLKLIGGNYVFLLDFWSYGHNPRNHKHRVSAATALSGLPASISTAFEAHYGKGIAHTKGKGNGKAKMDSSQLSIVNTIPNTNPDSDGDTKGYQDLGLMTDEDELIQSPPSSTAGDGPAPGPEEIPAKPVTFDTIGKRFLEIQAQLVAAGRLLPPADKQARSWQAIRSGAMKGVGGHGGTDESVVLAALNWCSENLAYWRERMARPAEFDNGQLWREMVNQYLNRAPTQTSQYEAPEAAPDSYPLDGLDLDALGIPGLDGATL